MKRISSVDNKLYKSLRKIKAYSKVRKKEGLYIVEGEKAVADLEPCTVKYYLVSDFFYHSKEDIGKGIEDKTIILDDKLYKVLTDEQSPQGVMALVRMGNHAYNEKEISKIIAENPKGLYLALEGIQDPGNLGTIIRTSLAVGVDILFLSKETVDPYNAKSIKSSASAINKLKIVKDVDLESLLGLLKKFGVEIYAADVEEASIYYDENYRARTCFLIGNEGGGLRQSTKELANKKVHIPMENNLESLNAAVSASILLYEAYRQKNKRVP